MGGEKIVGGPAGRIAEDAAKAIGQQIGKDAVESTAGAVVHGAEGAADDVAKAAGAVTAVGGAVEAGGAARSIARDTKDLMGAGHPVAPPSAPPSPPGSPIGAIAPPETAAGATHPARHSAATAAMLEGRSIALQSAAIREIQSTLLGEMLGPPKGSWVTKLLGADHRLDRPAIGAAVNKLGYLENNVPKYVADRIARLPLSATRKDHIAVYRDALREIATQLMNNSGYKELVRRKDFNGLLNMIQLPEK